MNRHSRLLLLTAVLVVASLTMSAGADEDEAYGLIVSDDKPLPCYGPCITANISRTQVNIGESVTVTGVICPPQDNLTIRVTFTRPDYTWVDQYVVPDNKTGLFEVTQQLDMAGFWNIFPIYGHISDRLYANVTDPNPAGPTATPRPLPPFKTNWTVLALATVAVGIAVTAVAVGTRVKTRKVSSLRLFVQIAFVFLIFFGAFIDHQNIPVPAEQIAPHEFLLGAGSLSPMPDGLPIPAFGCWYPCGRTVTCPLWQLQVYIFPFWNAGRGWGVDYVWTGLERLAVVVGIVVLASVLLGRWWCGWVCPFGLYVDLITRLRKAVRIKHRNLSPGFNARFHQLSYVILALMLILSVLFASQAIVGAQVVPGTENGGFITTYFSAPFCQFCPMKPLCAVLQTGLGVMKPEWTFGPTTGAFWQLGQYITSLNLFILIVVTVAAFFVRRSWCRICPLGGLIALFNRFPPFKWVSGVKLDKTEEKCTKCGVCKRVCPTQVTEVYEKKGGDVTTSQCILCLRCVEMCPYEGCLKFKVVGKTAFKSRNWLENGSGGRSAEVD
ncbi:MAG: 4Fe-4S binding protein [Candidatus Bathyarchaeia archaeon]